MKMSNQSVIKYTLSSKKSELVKVKLKTVDNNNSKLKEFCAVFDKSDIKALLYVIEDFQISFEALELDINNYETMRKFSKKVLGHGAIEKFRKLVQRQLYVNTVVENRVAQYAFEKLLKGFIKVYCTRTDLKGDVITYLKSDGCKKPKETSISDHRDRMEEIMQYCTFLEGARDDLSEDETKTILFNSFPVQW